MTIPFEGIGSRHKGSKQNNSTKRMSTSSTSETTFYIVGPNELQNKLLVLFLEQTTGLNCMACSQMEQASTAVNNKTDRKHLIIRDCLGVDVMNIWNELEIHTTSTRPHCFIALWNIDPDNDDIDTKAVEGNIRGIFYYNEPLERFLKGIRAIMRGELWFSRKTLSKYIFDSKKRTQQPENIISTSLTVREREILIRIKTGASNKKIAEDLCISPHTVRMHLYNIYKKIRVTNRLQATLWVKKNLGA